MAYSGIALANAFIKYSSEGLINGLSPMKLQRLLFYAQSWHLREFGMRPLTDDNFARWRHGPVIPSLHHKLKNYGVRSVDCLIRVMDHHADELSTTILTIPESDSSAHDLIAKIINKYGGLQANQLSGLSQEPGSSWAIRGGDGSVIDWKCMATLIHPEYRFFD